jgi:hypothetical protein
MHTSPYPSTTIRLILIIVGVVGILLNRSGDAITTILFIVQLVALDLMLRESKIYYTVYYRAILISMFFYITGALLKIMHWQGSDLLLIISFTAVALAYLLRTINKKNKILLDYVKCAWVVSVCTTAYLTLMHLPYSDIGNYVNLGLFGVMLLLFFISPPATTNQTPIDEGERPFDMVD